MYKRIQINLLNISTGFPTAATQYAATGGPGCMYVPPIQPYNMPVNTLIYDVNMATYYNIRQDIKNNEVAFIKFSDINNNDYAIKKEYIISVQMADSPIPDKNDDEGEEGI